MKICKLLSRSYHKQQNWSAVLNNPAIEINALKPKLMNNSLFSLLQHNSRLCFFYQRKKSPLNAADLGVSECLQIQENKFPGDFPRDISQHSSRFLRHFGPLLTTK